MIACQAISRWFDSSNSYTSMYTKHFAKVVAIGITKVHLFFCNMKIDLTRKVKSNLVKVVMSAIAGAL